jgi:hypothetical protein
MTLASFHPTPKRLSPHAARNNVQAAVAQLNQAMRELVDADADQAARAASAALSDERAREILHRSRVTRERNEIPIDRTWLTSFINAAFDVMEGAASDLRKRDAHAEARLLDARIAQIREQLDAKFRPEEAKS